MFKSLLVVPSSPDPDPPVLRRALELAAPGAALEVFDAVYEPLLEGYLGNREIYEPLRRRVVGERQQRARALADAARARGLNAAAKAVWDHPLPEAVAKEATAVGADLLVTAPQLQYGGSGLSHTDWQIVITSPVPTLIVKTGGRLPYRKIVAAVDPFHAHAKPAALDALILAQATALQRASGAELTVLHCFAPLTYFGADLGAAPGGERFDDRRRAALDELLRAAALPAHVARIEAGAPDAVLTAMAERGEADLIVMGALARGRVRDFLIGNTAERVLHHGNVDVLALKPTTAV